MKIYKYLLPKDKVTLSVEWCNVHSVLKFGMQNGVPCAWVIVDENHKRNYMIECVYTGNEFATIGNINSNIGTILVTQNFVLHYCITPTSHAYPSTEVITR